MESHLESQGVVVSSFIFLGAVRYVPLAGTMAVVEFEQADEAVKAFRAVPYRRLGGSVVYLEMEKGPMRVQQGTLAVR